MIVQFSDIFDSVVFDKMLPHKLRGEQSQCQNIECFAKPWLIFTFLVFFARFAIFVKIDTLQRRISIKPMPIVCCAGFDIFVFDIFVFAIFVKIAYVEGASFNIS